MSGKAARRQGSKAARRQGARKKLLMLRERKRPKDLFDEFTQLAD